MRVERPTGEACSFLHLTFYHQRLTRVPLHTHWQDIIHTFEYTHLLVSLSQTVTMTDRSLVKKPRPVVFSLAELERYPTLEDRYAITLPFRDPAGHCYCNWYKYDCADCELRYSEIKAKCIKRTGERWAVSTPSEPRLFALQQPGPSIVNSHG